MPNENENDNKKPEQDIKPAPKTPTADEIIELKKNYVSKKELDAIKAERDQAIADRNKVYESVLNGEGLPQAKEKKPIQELRQAYREAVNNKNATNLEVVSAQIELRDALVEAGELDPFAPSNPTPDDLAAAARVADVKRQCVREANGDPKKFVYLFESRIANDDPALTAAIKKRSLKRK